MHVDVSPHAKLKRVHHRVAQEVDDDDDDDEVVEQLCDMQSDSKQDSSVTSTSSSSTACSTHASGGDEGDVQDVDGIEESEEMGTGVGVPYGLGLGAPKVTTHTSSSADLRQVLEMLGSASNILVVTGAGISASSGIPTFRGDGNFYDTITRQYGLSHPHHIMDAAEFKKDPRPFFKVASRLYPTHHLPSAAHKFIRRLELSGRLLRLYTQNIDSLEHKAGIENVVYCHGSFATATCMRCHTSVDGSAIQDDVGAGNVALCKALLPLHSSCSCSSLSHLHQDHDLHDNDDDEEEEETEEETEEEEKEQGGEDMDGGQGKEEREMDWQAECSVCGCGQTQTRDKGIACGGVLKPDIVMFNEELPAVVTESLMQDLPRADLLLVMGTSLSVAPVVCSPAVP